MAHCNGGVRLSCGAMSLGSLAQPRGYLVQLLSTVYCQYEQPLALGWIILPV